MTNIKIQDVILENNFDCALVSDLEARLGVSNLLHWIDIEANRLAQLGYSAYSGVRFTSKLLQSRNIERLSIGSTVIGESASIAVGTTGYIINYRDKLPIDHLRFCLAHEIGHTYWFDSMELGKPISPFQSNVSSAATIEVLCDYFAGALLLPRQQIEKVISDNVTSTIPPLHLIPSLSQSFQVADQAVARRLIFQICPQKAAILRLRKRSSLSYRKATPDDGWKISWCAVPRELRNAHMVDGLSVPFLSSSRRIPDDMVPKPESDKTEYCDVDGRWWEGLKAQNSRESKIPFRSRLRKSNAKAFVFRNKILNERSFFDTGEDTEYIYLVLPLP